MKIVISGVAAAVDRTDGAPVTDPQRLAGLDGLAYAKDTCDRYLSAALTDIGVAGGLIELSFPGTEAKLTVRTTYNTPQKLTKGEFQKLLEETSAQLSDGIGEGEFQHAEDLGIDVDIFPGGSDLSIEQIEDGVVATKPNPNALLLHLKKFRADEKAAIALLETGVAISEKDNEGSTPLELACRAVQADLFELLWQRGALAHVEKPSRMLTKLSFCSGNAAVLEKSVRIAKRLIEAGVDVDTRDDSGCTPLMMAANRNNLPLVRYLLSQGANINAQRADENNRHTVLMQAQDIAMVQFLLEQGADPAIRNASGENAYEERLRQKHRSNHMEIAKLLEQS